MKIRTRLRTVIVGAVAASVALALTACGTPPWQVPGSGGSSKPTPSSSEIITIKNDLATGSTQRILTAGDITLTVNYYSTLNMGQWYTSANKPVSFSMSAKIGSDFGQRVYLNKVSVDVAVHGPAGALSAPAAISDQASVNPGYFVKDPYSYSQTFVLPPVDTAATSLTLTFTYELLLQTTPTSNDYAKQTAADTLTIALAGP